MTRATWKVLKRGRVPQDATQVEFECQKCGHEALLPVLGLPIAHFHGGLVFDVGNYAMPDEIQCRYSRRRFEVA